MVRVAAGRLKELQAGAAAQLASMRDELAPEEEGGANSYNDERAQERELPVSFDLIEQAGYAGVPQIITASYNEFLK